MSDITPSSADSLTGTGGGFKQWFADHKAIAIGGAGVLVVGVILYLKHRAATSSTSTSSTTNAAGTTDQGELYELPTSDGAYGADQAYTSGIQGATGATGPAGPAGPAGPSGKTTTTPTSGSSGDTASAANEYPVGTRVTASETIIQALWDPVRHTWLDLTSKGGIYTSGGGSVSGSAYNPNATSGGRIALSPKTPGDVDEYGANGVFEGVYKVT